MLQKNVNENIGELWWRLYLFIYLLCLPLGLLTREDGTNTLSENVGKQLPHDAA
jgi:hypothetical protein